LSFFRTEFINILDQLKLLDSIFSFSFNLFFQIKKSYVVSAVLYLIIPREREDK